jgi:hypothetical protein
MIPDNTIDYDETLDVLNDYVFVKQPSKTYMLRFESDSRVKGYVDEKEAVKQAIFLILSTERYKYIIYSDGYGIELADLFGKDVRYVTAVLPDRIKEALTQDDRIEDVTDFQFETNKHKVFVKFKAVTQYGEIETEWEVDI